MELRTGEHGLGCRTCSRDGVRSWLISAPTHLRDRDSALRWTLHVRPRKGDERSADHDEQPPDSTRTAHEQPRDAR